MKDQRSIVFSLCVILGTGAFAAAVTTAESVASEVINKEDNSPSRLQYQATDSISDGRSESQPVYAESNSSQLEKLDNCSYEGDVLKLGCQYDREVIFHEIFSELNKLLQYVLIATEDLKSEYQSDLPSNATVEAVSVDEEDALGIILSKLRGTSLEILLERLKKCVPISNIQLSTKKLRIAFEILLYDVQGILSHAEFNSLEILQEISGKILFVTEEISSLFDEYSSNNSIGATDLVLTTISWIKLAYDSSKSYIEGKLLVYVRAALDLVDFVYLFTEKYQESELSKTITKLIFSTNETIESRLTFPLLQKIFNETISDQLRVSVPTSTETVTTAHLPVSTYISPVFNEGPLKPNDSSSSIVPDQNLPLGNDDQSEHVISKPSSCGLTGTSKDHSSGISPQQSPITNLQTNDNAPCNLSAFNQGPLKPIDLSSSTIPDPNAPLGNDGQSEHVLPESTSPSPVGLTGTSKDHSADHLPGLTDSSSGITPQHCPITNLLTRGYTLYNVPVSNEERLRPIKPGFLIIPGQNLPLGNDDRYEYVLSKTTSYSYTGLTGTSGDHSAGLLLGSTDSVSGIPPQQSPVTNLHTNLYAPFPYDARSPAMYGNNPSVFLYRTRIRKLDDANSPTPPLSS